MTAGALVGLGDKKWCVIPVMRDDCLVLKLTVSMPACVNGCNYKQSEPCTERP
jgi:hypothetical protein